MTNSRSIHIVSAGVHFVELAADLGEQLKRDKREFRLSKKPSKRDLVRSEGNLLRTEEQYKLNSTGDFSYPEIHLKLDVTRLSPAKAAQQIVEAFDLETLR